MTVNFPFLFASDLGVIMSSDFGALLHIYKEAITVSREFLLSFYSACKFCIIDVTTKSSRIVSLIVIFDMEVYTIQHVLSENEERKQGGDLH